MPDQNILLALYDRLYINYGPQHWWPAESPFEVMVGAVLTQNTAWTNVEKAICNLKQENCLTPEKILSLEKDQLARLIKPSGYFNVKARRLKNLCAWLPDRQGYKNKRRWHTVKLRNSLLQVNGIGAESADDILLYAFQRPVFVIDVYTRRLLNRLGLIDGSEKYETLRAYFENALPADVGLFNEYHALIVRHAKEKCYRDEKISDQKTNKQIQSGICRHCLVEKLQPVI
jgi:endonuclease III related protein